jgi:hypothetical protein
MHATQLQLDSSAEQGTRSIDYFVSSRAPQPRLVASYMGQAALRSSHVAPASFAMAPALTPSSMVLVAICAPANYATSLELVLLAASMFTRQHSELHKHAHQSTARCRRVAAAPSLTGFWDSTAPLRTSSPP